MSRKFKLSNKYYDEDFRIFRRVNIEIEKGLTVLVGCNGAGKTTFLNQIKQDLENKDIPYLFHSNLHEGEKEWRSKACVSGNFEFLAQSMMSSEGENIVLVMGEIARRMGDLSRRNQDAKELWYLFDAIDSGLSIDNVLEIKEVLIPLVLENNKDKEVYFVISANEYELARNEKCFDVMNGKYISFKDYEDYRSFILKSKEQKNKRYKE